MATSLCDSLGGASSLSAGFSIGGLTEGIPVQPPRSDDRSDAYDRGRMMGPWLDDETEAVAEVRRRLEPILSTRAPFPDVVGDRKIMRFLRAKQMKLDAAVPLYEGFLKWREENHVDDIRHDILYNKKWSPYDFPHGRKILDLSPQIIICATATDHQGRPVVLESYDIHPSELFKVVTKEEYLQFLMYCLEYRSLVMEQLSLERDRKYLESVPAGEDPFPGYGEVILNMTIRDLRGVGWSHFSGEGRALFSAAIQMAIANYPEHLGKSYLVNTPWIFHSMWYVIKAFLDENTVAKFSLSGSEFLNDLLKEMPLSSIPACLGGTLTAYNEPFEFDLSETGPFYLAGTSPQAPP